MDMAINVGDEPFDSHREFFQRSRQTEGILNTMTSERLLILTVTCYFLIWFVTCDDFVEIRSTEDDIKAQEEKELIEALQEVLEKLKNKQNPSTEKRLGWIPSCDAGEHCAVRKGARIGKVCSCPGGTVCSFSILKCL